MKCANPIKAPNGSIVPCGRCMGCRVNHTSEWTTRLLHEAQYHKEMCFITLTYEDMFLPPNNSLSKEHVTKFLDDLRHDRTLPKIRYYLVGEYGEKTDRPHYHMICYGWIPPIHAWHEGSGGAKVFDSLSLSRIWPYGSNAVGYVSHDSIQYVAKYCQKKLTGELGKAAYESTGRVAPFQRQSQGIGLKFLVDHQEQLEKQLTVDGCRRPLPRYYIKKSQYLTDTLHGSLKARLSLRLEAASRGISYDDMIRLRLDSDQQASKNLESKLRMFRPDIL